MAIVTDVSGFTSAKYTYLVKRHRHLLMQHAQNAEDQAIRDASTYGSPDHDESGYRASPSPTPQQYNETARDYARIKHIMRVYQNATTPLAEAMAISEFALEKYAYSVEEDKRTPGSALEFMRSIREWRAQFSVLPTQTQVDAWISDGATATQPIDVDLSNGFPAPNAMSWNRGSAAQPILIDSHDPRNNPIAGPSTAQADPANAWNTATAAIAAQHSHVASRNNKTMAAAPNHAQHTHVNPGSFSRAAAPAATRDPVVNVLPPGMTKTQAQAIGQRLKVIVAQGVSKTDPEYIQLQGIMVGIHKRLAAAKRQGKRKEEPQQWQQQQQQQQQQQHQSVQQGGQMEGLEVFSVSRG